METNSRESAEDVPDSHCSVESLDTRNSYFIPRSATDGIISCFSTNVLRKFLFKFLCADNATHALIQAQASNKIAGKNEGLVEDGKGITSNNTLNKSNFIRNPESNLYFKS